MSALDASGSAKTPTAQKIALPDQVYLQICRLIDSGDFPPGVRLPSELELSGRFGVSRPVVRSALARLNGEGIVESRRGSGTIVRRSLTNRPQRLPEINNIADLHQYYDFRIDVERCTALLAAERRTATDIDRLKRTIEAAEKAIRSGDTGLAADSSFAFHRDIAAISGNRFHQTVIDQLPKPVGLVASMGKVEQSDRLNLRLLHALDEHRVIFEKIAAGDGESAQRAMVEHIVGARNAFYEDIPLYCHMDD